MTIDTKSLKTVILAGGLGTRLSEETHLKPKPMVEIGGKPILWHIMKIYSHYGLNEFIICAGYKGYVIKEYFANYFMHMSDITFDIKQNKFIVHRENAEPWSVTIVDTGDNSNTGGRIKRIKKYINEEDFFLTYGDGVSDININKLYSFHKKHKKQATLTAIQPSARYGALKIKNNIVKTFDEKPAQVDNWVNGGFFVLNKSIFKYIKNDLTIWEAESLKKISQKNQLMAYKHKGFWQSMDTLREKNNLEKLWTNKKPPWKVWKN